MSKYVLECPKCDARFNLKKYVPDRRVRCRKCRAVIIIPMEDGTLPIPKVDPAWQTVDPELNKKLARIFSVKKLTVVASLLLVALIGGALILISEYNRQRIDSPKDPEKRVTSPEAWVRTPHAMPLPLAFGLEWTYDVGTREDEKRAITGKSMGPDGQPQFDLAITHEDQGRILTLRVESEGIYVITEQVGAKKYSFDPPMVLVPLPVYLDSKWTYDGNYTLQGGGTEHWKLAFTAEHETVTTIGGTRLAYKIHMTGTKGLESVDETILYCNGLGVVRHETPGKAKKRVATLKSFNSTPPEAPIPETSEEDDPSRDKKMDEPEKPDGP